MGEEEQMWRGRAGVGMGMSRASLWRTDVTGKNAGDLPLAEWHIPVVLSVRKAATLPGRLFPE